MYRSVPFYPAVVSYIYLNLSLLTLFIVSFENVSCMINVKYSDAAIKLYLNGYSIKKSEAQDDPTYTSFLKLDHIWHPYSDKFLTLLTNLSCVLSYFLNVQVSSRALDTSNYR